MKKRLIFSIITLCLVIGGGFLYFTQFAPKDESVAIGVTYDSVEELYDNSNLVIKGKIGDFKEITATRGDRKVIERLYNVEVNKVFSNTSSTKVENKDEIILSVAVGFLLKNDKGEDVIYYVSEPEFYDMKVGNYLLFLNEYNDPQLNQTVFFNNSPNNLYMESGKEFKNVVGKGKKEVAEKEIEMIVNKKD